MMKLLIPIGAFAALLMVLILAIVSPGHAKTQRSHAVRSEFQRLNPCPSPEREGTGRRGRCPGYIVDHIKPLACGGADATWNMQWQTVEEAREKDRRELGCF